MREVCVIGAGVAGITVASLLSKRKDLKVTVLESRKRINGRLDSIDLTPELKARGLFDSRKALKSNFLSPNQPVQSVITIR